MLKIYFRKLYIFVLKMSSFVLTGCSNTQSTDTNYINYKYRNTTFFDMLIHKKEK